MIGRENLKSKRNGILLMIFCLFFLTVASAAGKDKEEFTLLTGYPLKLSGYTQVRYISSDDGINGFRIRRARVGLQGEVLKNITYKLSISAEKSPALLEAWIETSIIPHTRIKFGQFKVPFSLENLTSSSALDSINRSETVGNLCPGRDIDAQGRDIGLTFSGEFFWIEYNLGVFNGSGINRRDHNVQKDVVGRLILSPVSSLSFGLSHYQGKYTRPAGGPSVDRDRTGLEIAFNQGELSIKGEYIVARDDRTDRYGWYTQGAYYLIPERIQAVVKYDSYDANRDIQGNRIDVFTLGLNWFFSKMTKLQINYEHHTAGLTGTSENVVLAQFQAGF